MYIAAVTGFKDLYNDPIEDGGFVKIGCLYAEQKLPLVFQYVNDCNTTSRAMDFLGLLLFRSSKAMALTNDPLAESTGLGWEERQNSIEGR